MFKSCCGCKNGKTTDKGGDTVDTEAYGGVRDAAGAVKINKSLVKASPDTPLPNVTVTEPDDGTLNNCKAEADTRDSEKQTSVVTRGNDTRHEAVEGEDDEGPADEPDELLADVEMEAGGRSRLSSEDGLDRATLQAVARGMLATPHPAKRNSGGGVPALAALPQWLSQEDDDITAEGGGTAEPPATPVGRDELALRRHRFFSDLLQAHQAGAEHRVHFDPLGPVVAGGEYRHSTNLSFRKSEHLSPVRRWNCSWTLTSVSTWYVATARWH